MFFPNLVLARTKGCDIVKLEVTQWRWCLPIAHRLAFIIVHTTPSLLNWEVHWPNMFSPLTYLPSKHEREMAKRSLVCAHQWRRLEGDRSPLVLLLPLAWWSLNFMEETLQVETFWAPSGCAVYQSAQNRRLLQPAVVVAERKTGGKVLECFKIYFEGFWNYTIDK